MNRTTLHSGRTGVPPRPALYAALAALALLAGCDDTSTHVAPAAPAVEAPSLSMGDGGTGGLMPEPRFSLEIEAAGSFRPGNPVHLTLIATANYATREADLRLILPEVAGAERTGWEFVDVPLGEEPVPHLQERRGLAAGERVRLRTNVTIETPGYYSVLAHAQQLSDDNGTDRGATVTESSVRELWIWVAERDGRVTATFDPALFDAASHVEPGILSPRDKPSKYRSREGGMHITCTILGDGTYAGGGCPSNEGLPYTPPPADGTGTKHVTVIYTAYTGGAVPLMDARIDYRVYDIATGQRIPASGTNLRTNSSGYPGVIHCGGPSANTAVEVDVYTENDRVRVYEGSAPAFRSQRMPCDHSTSTLQVDKFISTVFFNLVKTHEQHSSVFGMPLPFRIPARIYTDTRSASYDWTVPELRFNRNRVDQVQGTFGAFAAAHETGHMWMDRYLGGLMRMYQGCPVPHYMGAPSTLKCAWAEGFADWYGVIVRGLDTGQMLTEIQNNTAFTNCVPGYPAANSCPQGGTTDGAIVEGAVAALLLDLTDYDAFNEPHDRIKSTPLIVTDIVKSCRVEVDGYGRAYEGIDHILFCMDNQRPPYNVFVNGSTQRFFPTRSNLPTRADIGTVGVNLDDLRRAWLANLYFRRVGYSPTFSASPMPEEPDPIEPPPPSGGCEGTQISC